MAVKRHANRLLLAFSFVAGLALLAMYMFLQSPFFTVKEIHVTGAIRFGEAEIRGMSGVPLGTSIWRLDPEAVASRLRQHPWIGRAEVTRRLPASLSVFIEERRPLAVVPYEGYYLALDAQGVALSIVDDLLAWDVPVITGAETPVFVAGQVYPVRAVNTALAAYTGLGEEYVGQVAELHLSEPDGLTLWFVDGLRAEVGRDGNLDEKLVLLRTILLDAQVKQRRLTSVDVRYQPPLITFQEGE